MKQIALNRKDVVAFYQVDHQNEGLFWAMLDDLIETTAIKKISDSVSFYEAVEHNWPQTFPDLTFHKIITDYINKFRLWCKLLYQTGASNIKSQLYMESMLSTSMYKSLVGLNPECTLQEINKKYTDKAKNFQNVAQLIKKLDQIHGDYYSNSENIQQIRDIFNKNADLYDDMYNAVSMEIQRRGSSPFKNDYTEIEEQYLIALQNKEEDLEDLRQQLQDYLVREKNQFKYANTQYKRAIKDLLEIINAPGYGRILDRLWAHTTNKQPLEINEITKFLENLFIALETFDIVPEKAESVGKLVTTKAAEIGKTYLANQDIGGKANKEIQGIILSPLWTFKGETVFLPIIDISKKVGE